VLRCFDARRSLSRRELPGAPGPRAVAAELKRWERALGIRR
jgi:argininosuccinate lyase